MGVEDAQSYFKCTQEKRDSDRRVKPCQGPGGYDRNLGPAVPSLHRDPCLPCEAGRECNQIMTRYSKLQSLVAKATRQGAWKRGSKLFSRTLFVCSLSAPSVPKPFPSLSASPNPPHPSFFLPPSWALLPRPPAPGQTQGERTGAGPAESQEVPRGQDHWNVQSRRTA